MPTPHQSPPQFELSPVEGSAQYLVHSELEIAFILRAIMHKNTLVSVYFSHGNDFILTSILDIDAEHAEMVLDYGANDELNQHALQAEKLVFVTSQDQIKVQFVCDRIKETEFEGRGAFSVAIPQSLLRMQRREYYRIATPVIDPLKCTIPSPAADSSAQVIVFDISCGGIAVIDHHPKIDFEPGTIYDDCRMVLPEIGTLSFAIRVRSTSEVTLKNGLVCKRSGCEFIAMPEKIRALVQRYIMKLERERKAKETGMR